jgi:hypothetical protein
MVPERNHPIMRKQSVTKEGKAIIRTPKDVLEDYGLVDEDGDPVEAHFLYRVNEEGRLELTFVDEDGEPIKPTSIQPLGEPALT